MANAALLERYRVETREIIEEVLRDGSDPDALYLIEHHISSDNAEKLERLIPEAFRLGYELDDPEEMEADNDQQVFCCDLIIESRLNADIIDQQVAQVLDLVEKHQVNYDGWGTWFEDPDAEDEDDNANDDEE